MATTVKIKKAPKQVKTVAVEAVLAKKIRQQITEKAEDGCPFC